MLDGNKGQELPSEELCDYYYKNYNISRRRQIPRALSNLDSVKEKTKLFSEILLMTKEDLGKTFILYPKVVKISNETIKNKIDVFLEMGIGREYIAHLIKYHPDVLNYNINDIKKGIENYLKYGFRKIFIKKLFIRYPMIFTQKILTRLNDQMKYFKSIEVNINDLENILEKYPRIIGLSLEKSIKPKYEYFIEYGISKKVFGQMIKQYPKLLTLSMFDSIEPNLEFLKDWKIPEDSLNHILTIYPKVLSLNLERDILDIVEVFKVIVRFIT